MSLLNNIGFVGTTDRGHCKGDFQARKEDCGFRTVDS